MTETDNPPRLRADAVARLSSTGSRLVAAFFSSIVTARWLGTSGKGALSTLHYISSLLAYACSLGLGEASIVLVNQGRHTLQTALSSSIAPIVAASFLGVGCLFATAWVAGWSGIWVAVIVASAYVVVDALSHALLGLQDARFGIALTSRIYVITSAIGVVAVILFVAGLNWGIAGAMAAALVSSGMALWLSLRRFRIQGFTTRPASDRSFLRGAIRTGLAMEGAHLVMALTQRVDLLIVYWLVGESAAGIYSIALTIGLTASYSSGALAYAALPRVAAAGRLWRDVAVRVARMATLVGAIAGALLAIATPILVPLLFGDDFRGAVPIGWALIVGGVIYGMASNLARSLAGSGRPNAHLSIFLVMLVTMLALDLALIPTFGVRGAAAASVTSSCSGLAAAVVAYRRLGSGLRLADVRPGAEEWHQLRGLLRSLTKRNLDRPPSDA